MAENDKNIIVSRIQNRRGLKQDLPQPLRPGELGLATDSRQVYIGSDPQDPNAAPYNNISYYENTVGARDHTLSVANNNIIAFQVPFIKYVRGEFNGIQTEKSWEHSDARSIISQSDQPSKQYMSSTYSVFKSERIQPFEHTLNADVGPGVLSLNLNQNSINGDLLGYIRIGDAVSIPGSTERYVTNVTRNTSTGIITVTLNTGPTDAVSANSNVTFTPRNIVNFSKYDLATGPRTSDAANTKLQEGVFVSSDVAVYKNGIKLVPESNSSIVDMPSAVADYVLDGSNVNSQGTHFITLRTRPDTKDELSVCYYSNANVIQSIQGTNTGNISSTSSVQGFYSQYNIHSSRHIPVENIRVNETTGLGYIGLQQKHIVASADGANISNPGSLSLGNLLIARSDITNSTTAFTRTTDDADATAYTGTVATVDHVYSPVSESNRGQYRYNRVYTTQTAGTWFHEKLFDVTATDSGVGNVTIEFSGQSFQHNRPVTANINTQVSGSGFTDNVSATSTWITFSNNNMAGVKQNDYVRILDSSGNPSGSELHGTVFKVYSVNGNSFNVDISSAVDAGNSIPAFTSNTSNYYFMNHGDLANVNTSIQLLSPDHGLTSDVGNVKITEAANSHLAASEVYAVNTRTGDGSDVFFISGSAPALVDADNDMSSSSGEGEFHPKLEADYSDVKFTPVLAIDLSGVSTLKHVISAVNKGLVSIPEQSTSDVQIFPLMDYLTQADGSMNRVYLTQRPAYASLGVGGLPFKIFEDSSNTLSSLGLTPGTYDRNSSVRAKLEQWFNDMVIHRDVNLFTNVFLGGTAYNSNINSTNNLGRYNLTLDDTFGEIIFADRQEAANFNFITNSAYANSAYDRASDSFEGTRGLVNLKNNLEIQTRDTASTGEKIVSFTSTEGTTILQSDQADEEIFGLDISTYDSYVIEYTISETPTGGINKYMRMGTMMIQGRSDFTDTANAVIFNDRFSSHWETSSVAAVVEPKFQATQVGTRIVVSMADQLSDPDEPGSSRIVHSLGNNLNLKYIVRRWSSTD